MSSDDAEKLLRLSSELIVTLRSWGDHLYRRVVHADGMRPEDAVKMPWIGEELSEHILRIREKEKLDEC